MRSITSSIVPLVLAPSCAQPRRVSAATAMFSRTLRTLKSSSRWNVRAMPRRARLYGGSLVMSRPSRRTRPALGARRPVITLNRVVLPAPFGPMRPVILPGSALNDTSSTATLPPKRTTTPSTSSWAIQLHFADTEGGVEFANVFVGERPRDAHPLERYGFGGFGRRDDAAR